MYVLAYILSIVCSAVCSFTRPYETKVVICTFFLYIYTYLLLLISVKFTSCTLLYIELTVARCCRRVINVAYKQNSSFMTVMKCGTFHCIYLFVEFF